MPSNKTEGGQPHPFDIYVGSRLRQQRKLRKMNQDALARALGVTFQQVQKYEHGTNRISMSRIFDIMNVLEVDFDYFLDGYPHSKKKGKQALPIDYADGWIVDIARSLSDVKDTGKRRQIREFIALMLGAE